jgi:ribosome biogenesis protein YTM1
MDRTISIYDPRPSSTSSIVSVLPTGSPISALKCHPTSTFTMMGVTYSGLVQIWDIRSPKSALFSVQKSGKSRYVTAKGKRLGERLLAGDWDGEMVVAGGEDGEVGIWNARGE